MTVRKTVFSINDEHVIAPDEHRWEPIVLGVTHNNIEIRSPYWELVFRKDISDGNSLDDWLQHDNSVLDSITVPSHSDSRTPQRYTDATCLNVQKRYTRGRATGIIATFRVNTES